MIRLQDRATTHRFFSCPPWPLKLFTIYVWGDALVIVPLWIAIVIVLIINLKFGLMAICILYAVRGLGEMIYWIHQQFGAHAYRPNDFGFKHFDNHAVYILYQLLATAQITMALGALAYLVLNH